MTGGAGGLEATGEWQLCGKVATLQKGSLADVEGRRKYQVLEGSYINPSVICQLDLSAFMWQLSRAYYHVTGFTCKLSSAGSHLPTHVPDECDRFLLPREVFLQE